MFLGCGKNVKDAKKDKAAIESAIIGYSVKSDSVTLLKKNSISLVEKGSVLFDKAFESEVVAFKTDKNSNIIFSLKDGSLIEFDVATKEIKYIESFFEPIPFLGLSGDEKYLIGISENNKILIIDRKTKAMGMGSYNEKVFDVRVSDDNTKVFVQFEDRLEILDFLEKKVLETVKF